MNDERVIPWAVTQMVRPVETVWLGSLVRTDDERAMLWAAVSQSQRAQPLGGLRHGPVIRIDAGCGVAWVVSHRFRPAERACRGPVIRMDAECGVAWVVWAVGQEVHHSRAPESKRNVDQL